MACLAVFAQAVQAKGMVGELVVGGMGDFLLPKFDDFIAEFRNAPAFDAHDMVVVLAAFQLENRVAAFKMMAFDEARRLELGQDTVDCRQAYFLAFLQQSLVDFFGGEVTLGIGAVFQHLQNLDPRRGDFQPRFADMLAFLLAAIFRHLATFRLVFVQVNRVSWHATHLLNCNHNMRKHLVLIACLGVAACSNAIRIPFVYRIDIHQGNIYSQDMVDQLRPGMTKRQVAFIMGTPLLEDAFHSDRWDYVYSDEPGGEDRVAKKFSVFFENDELAGLEGDLRPTNNPSTEGKKDVIVNIPKIKREKTLWEAITGIFDD